MLHYSLPAPAPGGRPGGTRPRNGRVRGRTGGSVAGSGRPATPLPRPVLTARTRHPVMDLTRSARAECPRRATHHGTRRGRGQLPAHQGEPMQHPAPAPAVRRPGDGPEP
ncbi:hypothetical protein Sgou_04220 [Streptomyces gougerotii]|uniref:Uncharacterized protein n=1 Tax=Streptomyces gougerotii TaxID=53448 RepID=A0A8H9HDB0_9ACTN|nr:hypothetical protein Sgou_04220 [Streptomyces gougerotii]GGU58889.1 hypothetical protein GCM10010227_10190 [Streptomyces gougerotii]